LFSLLQNIQQPDCSMPPKSSWHAHLKEHKCVPGSITVHPEGEILELASLPGVFGMCRRILNRSGKDVAISMSRAHRSRAQ